MMTPLRVAFWAFVGPFLLSMVIFVSSSLLNTIVTDYHYQDTVQIIQAVSVVLFSLATFVIARFKLEKRLKKLSYNAFLSCIFSGSILVWRFRFYENQFEDFALFAAVNVLRIFFQSLCIAKSQNEHFVMEKLLYTYFSFFTCLYYSFIYSLPTIEFFIELFYLPDVKKSFLFSLAFYRQIVFIAFCVFSCMYVCVFFIQSRQENYKGASSSWFRFLSFIQLLMIITAQIFLLNPVSLVLSVIVWALWKYYFKF